MFTTYHRHLYLLHLTWFTAVLFSLLLFTCALHNQWVYVRKCACNYHYLRTTKLSRDTACLSLCVSLCCSSSELVAAIAQRTIHIGT